MTARPTPGYDPYCPLLRPHGHHWTGLGRGAENERECHGEPPPCNQPEETPVTHRIGIYDDENPDHDTTDDSGIYDDGAAYGQGRTEETP